jgi:hypothetical protein
MPDSLKLERHNEQLFEPTMITQAKPAHHIRDLAVSVVFALTVAASEAIEVEAGFAVAHLQQKAMPRLHRSDKT